MSVQTTESHRSDHNVCSFPRHMAPTRYPADIHPIATVLRWTSCRCRCPRPERSERCGVKVKTRLDRSERSQHIQSQCKHERTSFFLSAGSALRISSRVMEVALACRTRGDAAVSGRALASCNSRIHSAKGQQTLERTFSARTSSSSFLRAATRVAETFSAATAAASWTSDGAAQRGQKDGVEKRPWVVSSALTALTDAAWRRW